MNGDSGRLRLTNGSDPLVTELTTISSDNRQGSDPFVGQSLGILTKAGQAPHTHHQIAGYFEVRSEPVPVLLGLLNFSEAGQITVIGNNLRV